jgi:hypothetical protein
MTVTASKYARAENDLYQTEPWVTEALLRHFPVDGLDVWEPAAGNHLMADVLREQAKSVITSDIVTYSREHSFIMDFMEPTYGRSTECELASSRGGRSDLALQIAGNNGPLSVRKIVAEADVANVWSEPSNILPSAQADGHKGKAEMAGGARQRPVQGRLEEHSLQEDGNQGEVREMRLPHVSADSPSGRGPHQQCPEQSRSSLFAMPHEPPQNGMVAIEADCIITNPPYGKSNRQAVRFAELALYRCKGFVALLLTAKFDSGSTRRHLFADNPRFAAKIVLVDRISWTLDGETGTEDHAWFAWTEKPRLPRSPVLLYAGRKA